MFGILHLHPRDKKLIPLIGPFASVNAFLVNELGVQFGFWHVYLFNNANTLPAIPVNLGLYPILGCYLIFFIKKSNHPYLIVFLMTLFTTLTEAIFVLMGIVVYGNGWNIFWTFISYLVPYLFDYWFYLYLKKIKAME
ncbi:CBO0543 family protein [Domibacillus aminovorans]|uniref:CBO0543 family protein n=1 Tax=Domibacillus aminovorans TaxID=29332 RepID=UPI002FC91609